MRKKILILTLMLFLTGCTVNYNIDIKNNEIVENLSGTFTDEELENDRQKNGMTPITELMYNEQKALLNSEDLYQKSLDKTDEGYKYNLSYKYHDNYADSRLINSCFEKHNIEEIDDFYYIRAYGTFYCRASDGIKINVTSDYGIIESNAEKIDGDKYIWTIEDEDNVDLYLVLSKNIKSEKPKAKLTITTFQIVCFIILLILSAITFFMYRKKNGNNKSAGRETE